jgi:hypothetical protein
MTKTERVARHFTKHPREFVSAFVIDRLAPLSRTQTITRVRQRGLRVDHMTRKRGKQTIRGYVYWPKAA